MKVGQQRIHDPELKARPDEQSSVARPGQDPPVGRAPLPDDSLSRRRLERPDDCRAHSNDPTSGAARTLNRVAGLGTHRNSLGMHCVRLEIIHANGLECSSSNVQRYERALDASGLNRLRKRFVEMEAGGGRRDSAVLTRKYALVTLAIAGIGFAMNIGWEGHTPPLLEKLNCGSRSFNDPKVIASLHHAYQAAGSRDEDTLAHGFTGAHLRQCPVGVGVNALVGLQRPLQKNLDSPAGGFGSDQSCRHDAGVVEHEQIAGPQEGRQILHQSVAESAGSSFEHQQAASRAFGERCLGNQLFGELVREVIASHARMVT